MTSEFAQQALVKLNEAQSLYHRLVLLIAPHGGGKTLCLREVAQTLHVPVVNLSLELSRRMLELTDKQRRLRLLRLASDIVVDNAGAVVILDDIEMLFEPQLQSDALRVLQDLSRDKALLVAWPGHVEGRHLFHAKPDHPEHHRYERSGFLVVDAQGATEPGVEGTT